VLKEKNNSLFIQSYHFTSLLDHLKQENIVYERIMRRPYPFDQQFMFDHPYDDVANQLDSCVSYQQYNRKRQRRQAAAVVVESLWNNNNSNGNGNGNPTATATATIDDHNAASGRKSTAQPRPVLNVPPRGIGPIADPNENDVLCGRGGRINSHAGNVQFRDTIHSKKKEYLAPSTKKLEKAHIAAGIVNDIRTMDPPGRFLKEDKGTGLWFDIGDAKAIKKTGQALREDAPDIRPEIGGTGSCDSLDDSMIPMDKKKADTTKSKSLSPRVSRRGNTITGPQQNLQPVWPQGQEGNNNNNMQKPHPDYQAQIPMPPPFMPQGGNNNININNNINYAMPHPAQQQRLQQQHQQQHQQGFETRNIPIQVPSSQANHPSSSFPNQLYSGAQSVSNKVASASRKAMEALSQAGPTTNQQYAPYGYGSRPSDRSRREVHPDDVAFGRGFHDPEGQKILNYDDNTVSSISGISEPASSGMLGSGIGDSSMMNMSLKSNFSFTNSLRINTLRGTTSTNNNNNKQQQQQQQQYDPMAMSGLGLSGSIKSFGGSLTRSNSFPDMNCVVEGDNWKSIMEGEEDLLAAETALKNSGGGGGGRIGARNSSAMSIGSLMDVQSNASSTQWLAAAGLNYPTSQMPDDRSFMDKSFMSSAMMSADLDALDLASSERLNL
jgi:hypothetical protein